MFFTRRSRILGRTRSGPNGTKRHPGKSAPARPSLQELDDRSCPSCIVELVGTTLTITGDEGNNLVIVGGTIPGALHVQCDVEPAVFHDPIDRIVVNTGGCTASSLSSGQLTAQALGGNGNDELDVQVWFYQSELQEVFPGRLREVVTGYTDTAPLSLLAITADGGNGFDTCLHTAQVNLLNVEDD